MGNCCSNYKNKFKIESFELHIQDFCKNYRSLKFPKNVTFTGDPNIFRIQHQETNELYILKRITFSTEKDLTAFTKSLDGLYQIEHDNILKIYHYSIEKTQLKDLTLSYILNIILENFEHTLQDELVIRSKSNKPFTEAEVQRFLNSLVDAFEFLQLKELSLGDLRPSTIYLTRNKKPKIMFLGILPSEAVARPQDLSSVGYMSPQVRTQAAELLFSDRASSVSGSPMKATGTTPILWDPFKSEVFSLGLIVLDMMSKGGSKELSGNYRESIRRKYRVIQCGKEFGPFLCEVVKAMLRESELIRPDFIELKKMLVKQEYMESILPEEAKIYLKLQEAQAGIATKNETEGKQIDLESKLPAIKSINGLETADLSFLLGISEENRGGLNIRINTGDVFAKPGEPGYGHTSQKPSIETINGMKVQSNAKNQVVEREEPFFGPSKTEKRDEQEEELNEEEVEEKGSEEEQEREPEEPEEVEEESNTDEYHDEDNELTSRNLDNEEIVIENEDDLYDIYQKQMATKVKLVIHLEEIELAQETITILKEVISWQSSLNELVFSLPKAIGDNGLEMLCEGINQLQELTMCYFGFRDSEVTHLGLKKLGECLLRKMKVIQVALNFSDNNIDKEGCQELARWFKGLGKIKSLALNIGGNMLKNEGVIAVGNEIGKLEELESLTVFLYTNDIQGKGGIEVLVNEIKKLKKLEKLTLNLVSNLLQDQEMDVLLGFVKESEVDEVIVDLGGNDISEEGRKRAKLECVRKENVIIRF